MPATVPPVADERDGLLSYLSQQRAVLRLTAYGLTDDQIRRPGPTGPLTVGGLIKHVTVTERYWLELVTGGPQTERDYAAGFVVEPGETLEGLLAGYDAVAEVTEAVVADIADLGRPVPVPRGAPWVPADVDAWSVRWVLLHLIQETARHVGHADLVRESIDGATAFALMAAAEGWPTSAGPSRGGD